MASAVVTRGTHGQLAAHADRILWIGSMSFLLSALAATLRLGKAFRAEKCLLSARKQESLPAYFAHQCRVAFHCLQVDGGA